MNITQFKKPLLIAGVATTLGVAGLSTIGVASAATDSTHDTLVSKIATKFGLKEADVQTVFDEEKTEREAEHQAEVSDRLQDAVDDGKITAEQKTLIENKLKELQTARQTEMDQLQTWAEQQGLDDMRYLRGGFGPGSSNDYLQDAVDDGKITAEQKTAIEAKQDELKEKRDAAHDKLKQWLEDNNIDDQYFMMGKVMGGPGGHGGAERRF